MFHSDALAWSSAGAYSVLALIVLLAAPRQDRRDPAWRSSLAFAAIGSLLAYLAASPWLFLAGWCLTLVPLWRDRETFRSGVRLVHAASVAALAMAFLQPTPWVAFGLVVLATLLRKGVFPFQFWVPSAFEQGSLSYLALLLNGHLGAYALIRHGVPRYPEIAGQALPLLGVLAIVTSLYTALVALNARQPRRMLALLCTSQAAFILAGLENRNIEGITGALLHWWVVAFATTGLLLIYRSLEARTTEAASGGLLGLGFHAPRLAVFFAVSALALIGLPGTLGFVAEDLLFHGSLESHPLLGVGLPLATALNALTAFRLFSSLFLGRRGLQTPPIPDATAAERWAFTVPVLLLVAGGLAPSALLALRGPSAEWIAGWLR